MCLSPDLSMQYKNFPKIKVLRLPCQFNMIFSGIVENLLCKNYHGGSCHLATRVEGAPYPPGRTPALWAHGGPPPLIPAPTHFFFLLQTRISSSSTSSSSFCCHFFISLLKAPFTKLPWGIALWYVTPPMVQLVFVLVLYSLQICAA